MDVVAYAGDVRSGKVITKDRERRSFAQGHLGGDRDEVCFLPVSFSIGAVGTCNVEVAEADWSKFARVCSPRKVIVSGELGASIRIHRCRFRLLSDDRDVWFSIDGSGRGDDDLVNSKGLHGIAEASRPRDVVLLVFGRVLDVLSDE